MKPFDLRAFLCGAPAVTRSGKKVNIVDVDLDNRKLVVTPATNERFETTMSGHVLGGSYIQTKNHENDLVGMYEEPPQFENWNLFSSSVTKIEKVSHNSWCANVLNGRPLILLEFHFAASFFPGCPVGTVIERPKDE